MIRSLIRRWRIGLGGAPWLTAPPGGVDNETREFLPSNRASGKEYSLVLRADGPIVSCGQEPAEVGP